MIAYLSIQDGVFALVNNTYYIVHMIFCIPIVVRPRPRPLPPRHLILPCQEHFGGYSPNLLCVLTVKNKNSTHSRVRRAYLATPIGVRVHCADCKYSHLTRRPRVHAC